MKTFVKDTIKLFTADFIKEIKIAFDISLNFHLLILLH